MQATQHEEQATNIEGDLRVEREWRLSLQDTMQQEREKISKLQAELSQLRAIAQVSSGTFEYSERVTLLKFCRSMPPCRKIITR